MTWLLITKPLSSDQLTDVILNQIRDNILASGVNTARERGDIIYGSDTNVMGGRLHLSEGGFNSFLAARNGELEWLSQLNVNYADYINDAIGFRFLYLDERFIDKDSGLAFIESHLGRSNAAMVCCLVTSADFNEFVLSPVLDTGFRRVHRYIPESLSGSVVLPTDSTIFDVLFDTTSGRYKWDIPSGKTYRVGITTIGDVVGHTDFHLLDVQNDVSLPDFNVLANRDFDSNMLDPDWFVTKNDLETLLVPVSYTFYNSLGRLAVPSGVVLSPRGSLIDVSWNIVNGADSYEIQWRSNTESFIGANTSIISNNSARISSLVEDNIYYIRVKSTSLDDIDSAWSDEYRVVTASQLGRVSGVFARSSAFDTVAVSWRLVDYAEEYIVQWRENGDGYSSSNSSRVIGRLFYNISDLEGNTDYFVRVRAIGVGFTDGDWSFPVEVTTDAAPLGLVTFSLSNITSTSVDVSWNQVSNATNYDLELTDEESEVTITSIIGTSHTLSGLTAEEMYDLRMRARATGFPVGEWSDSLSFTAGMVPAPTATISIAPTSGPSGTSITATWSSTNAVSGSVTIVGVEVASGTSGTYNTTLTGSDVVTLVFTATGAGGETVSDSATFTFDVVVPPDPPPTASISVSPSTVTTGTSFRLTWSSTNAVSGAIETASSVIVASTTGGSQLFSSPFTGVFVYTFTVMHADGREASDSATLTVNAVVVPPDPPPTASISVSPSTVTTGTSFRLTWSSTNAVSGAIETASSVIVASTTGGSQLFSSPFTGVFVYTFTVMHADGREASDSATLTVNAVVVPPDPPPTASISVSPSTVTTGTSFRLTWSSTNAVSGAIETASSVIVASTTGGSQLFSSPFTGVFVYTFTVMHADGREASDSATLTVNAVRRGTRGHSSFTSLQTAGNSNNLFGIIQCYVVDKDVNETNVLVIPQQPDNVELVLNSGAIDVTWDDPMSIYTDAISDYEYEIEYRNAYVEDDGSRSWVSVSNIMTPNVTVTMNDIPVVALPHELGNLGSWIEVQVRAVNVDEDNLVLKYSPWSVSRYILIE